jgi:NAD(P)-dependent dehydrogenase (short-subunit alcohol dehydrogenase family)
MGQPEDLSVSSFLFCFDEGAEFL